MDGCFVNRFGKRTKDRFYEEGSLFKTLNIKNLFLFMAIVKNIKKIMFQMLYIGNTR